MIHKNYNPKTKINLIKLHVFTISLKKYMGKLCKLVNLFKSFN